MRDYIAEMYYGPEKAKEKLEEMNKCNHRYPDGSSALVCGGGMNSCQICNWDDW